MNSNICTYVTEILKAFGEYYDQFDSDTKYEPYVRNIKYGLEIRKYYKTKNIIIKYNGVTVYNENQTAIYNISKQLARDLGISEQYTKMIFARGNSMLPTIQGGDSLLVDMSKVEVYDGKIYCIRKEGQLYAKRLQKLSATQLKIISDNKDYEPIIIDFKKDIDTDFAILGEVRWAGRVFV